MNPIQHIRRFAGVLARRAGLAAALVAFGATPAFAMRPPPEPARANDPALSPWQIVGGYQVPGGVPVHTVQTVVAGGMPGWQITLIAVAAALLAATVAVLADRARASRREAATAAA